MPNKDDFNRFAVNPVNIDISRSMFNMDHSVKFSCNVGDVIPYDCIEVLPGDTFEIDTTKVVRLQPLVTPIMDEVILDVYHFFVPNRLIWQHWINFMGENTDSAWTPETEYNIPSIKIPEGGFDVGTIADYLGVPPKTGSGRNISALPFRAYALVCNQWFRSEAIMDPVHVHVDDTTRTGSNGSDQVTDIELGGKPFIACKFFDAFTGALPSPQRGPAVNLPIVGSSQMLPVVNGSLAQSTLTHPYRVGQTSNDPGVTISVKNKTSGSPFINLSSQFDIPLVIGKSESDGRSYLRYDNTHASSVITNTDVYFSNLYAKLDNSDFQAVSINDLRTAFAIQRYYEKSARYGGRYIEHIKAFFNVDSPDARQQYSEYLGGSRLSLNINSVEATSSQGQPIGTVAGMSVSADSNEDVRKSFTEDGLLLSCAVLRYHHSYQQGIDKMFLRKTNFDYYNPVFANLGEVNIPLDMIYFQAVESTGNSTFGYQERWFEYRYRPNRIAGEFRTVADTSLDMWHLGDFYDSRPYLSPEWIREDKSMLDRCLAVTSSVANQCLCDFFIKVKASRAMPLYSIPGLIDHH